MFLKLSAQPQGIIIITRAAPKLMPPIYFHGNYNRYKEHNNTI